MLNSDGSVTISPGTPDVHQIESCKVLSGTNPTGTAVWWCSEGQCRHKDHILLRAGIPDPPRL
ncbi:hypothetical protein [Bradyrhizobium iriomotense]|uniref:Uncharacterized protein n=1 Tax=Bradyrhizobium iriomotense TaxID=441950 RepID=A0ABQ6AWX4_9BRAD|nr:hypothetical protein [Bradyrhizobium iriomotense]GLR85935.1 hypothetical protein GCM10007857_26460 [Bradyrhizobium iriomotense]